MLEANKQKCYLCDNSQEKDNQVMGQPVCDDHSNLSPNTVETISHKIKDEHTKKPTEDIEEEKLTYTFYDDVNEKMKAKHPVGRPTDYTQEIGLQFCELIAQGYSARTAVTMNDNFPALSTIFRWLSEHKEFQEQYAYATQERTEAMAEDILDIADDGSNDLMRIQKGNETYEIENKEVTNRSRLRVDTRKWLMSKMKPKKYGEKLDVMSDGKAIQGNTIIFKDFKGDTEQ